MKEIVEATVEAGDIFVPSRAASVSSLTRKAVLAVALIIGYYVFSLAMVAALLYLSYYIILSAGIYGPAAILPSMFTIAGAISIFFSVLPRFDRFKPPGVRVKPAIQPRLFDLISEVARISGQRMPSVVQIVPEFNAWVIERGGIMGIGRRRYLAIGLPLFPLMTVSQLEAILAHEFGHFYSGHLKFGAWVWRTRDSLIRTVTTANRATYAFWVNLIFLPYAQLFLKLTYSISRYHEHEADELAARIAGREPAIEALQRISIGEKAFDSYWEAAVRPLVTEGRRPPIMEGFRRFVSTQHISDSLDRNVKVHLKDNRTDPYDSHPILPDRVNALKQLPDRVAPRDNTSALSLLDNLDELEQAFLKETRPKNARKLEPMLWQDVQSQIFVPRWERAVAAYAEGLKGVTPDSLPDIVKNLTQFTTVLVSKSGEIHSLEAGAGWHQRASFTLGSALTLALRNAGWHLYAAPAEPVEARRDGEVIRPFEVLGSLMSGALTPEAWRQQCVSAGISGMDFGDLTTSGGSRL
jgi:Zn-dependent protease with chaperone function